MHPVKRLAACFLLLLLLAACSSSPPDDQQREFYAMGTLVSVQLYDVPAARANALFDRIEADFQAMHHDWHAWEDGPLVHMNRALAAGDSFELPPVLAPLIPPAIRLAEQSDNLFNPALGRLFSLWGFQGNARHDLPDPAAIQAILDQQPRMSDLELDGNLVRSRNPAVAVDLGGFAKGWAVDVVIDKLRTAGVTNAIVNAGGDLRAIGRHGDRPWRIGIRHPRADLVLAAIDINGDEAAFTSGDYERYFEVDGQRYHHILDPRTGYPARGTASLTVLYPEAATADAAATALFVAGDDWPAIARRMGIDAVLRVATDGRIEMTPAMAERTTLLVEPEQPPVIVALPAVY